MPRIDVQIPTSDGVSKGTLHVPDGAGPWREYSTPWRSGRGTTGSR